MNAQISSKVNHVKHFLLVVCAFFYTIVGIGQTTAKRVYDSIVELPLSDVKKIELFKSELLHKKYTNKSVHADVCYDVVNFCKKINRNAAITFLKKEVYLRKQDTTPDRNLITKAYYNLGYFYRLQKDYTNQLTYLDSVVSHDTILDIRSGEAYKMMAGVYKNTGDYQRALDYFDTSEVIFKKVDAKSNLLGNYINKLSLYVEQHYKMTSKDFKLLEENVLSLEDELKSNDKKRLMVLFNLGAILYNNHAYKASSGYYEKSLPLAEKLKDSFRISQIYTNKALIDVKKGNIAKALELNDKALLFVGNDKDQRSTIYDNLGDIYIQSKEYVKGIRYYNKALNELLPFDWKTIENLPEYERIKNSPHRKDILGYLIDKQVGWLAYYEHTKSKKYLVAAEETLVLIDKVIDHLYFESKEKISKLFWRNEGAKLYINAVKIWFLLNKPAAAFYYIEKNKGIVLLDNVSAFNAKRIAKLPQTVIDKEAELAKKVKTLAQELFSSETKDSLEKNYFTAKETYYKYLTTIENEYPEYHRYRRSLPIRSTKNVQKGLAKNELVVAYILNNALGYVLVMDKENVKIYPLKDIETLHSKISSFKELYAKPFETKNEIVDYQVKGNEVYKELFPFRNDTIYQNATKITVVPDGSINALPLEILPTSTTATLHDSYLIQQKEISYQYSFSLDAENQLNYVEKEAKSISFMLTAFQDSSLTSLTVKPTEFFEDATYVNANATKEQFLNSYNNASEVYISSHAGNTNDVSWLAMFDEKVYPNELYFLNNPKELVVLNACKTSAGIFKEGEGVFSLTRAFLNSGSKSVVSSLWNLNEKSGMEIFENFRMRLRESQTKSEALHNAKINYLAKHKNTSESSPYYWGGIVLTGNTDILPSIKTTSYWWLLGAVLIIFIAAFLYYLNKNRAV
ncbi:CHAT domain-containing tetratricopeptide repeat protein [uncultured Kordia sp.]|uniref:CHAT domain-containing protein n=1 Tax=uncultured Kordia sp. TaxID=507699 RepID=UPI002615388F|nr:CHAT domain-containing tetratricopeptide repeat protein [uncultured Kordia sp.]